MRPRTRRILLQATIADAIVSAAAAIFLPAAAWAAQMPATGTIDVCDGLSLNIRSIDRLHPGEPVLAPQRQSVEMADHDVAPVVGAAPDGLEH